MAELCEQLPDIFAVAAPVHFTQDLVVDMLDGNIQIFDDLRLVCQNVDQLLRHFIGIEIMYPDPDQPVDFAEPAQQLRKLPLAVEIETVAAGILRDDDQLLDAVGRKLLRFLYQIFHRAAAELAAQLRNDAVRAVVIAALGNFQIGVIFRRCEDPAIFRLVGVNIVEALVALAGQHLPDRVRNIVIRARAKHAVDLRQLL